ncbi:uncharacterized protein [Haliotis asinina]|uniref:uncharacterized protein n=1 Tax=Haliotis asinina TaxID=109174 RepID=UPI0035319BF7
MHRNYSAPVHRAPILDSSSWSRKDSDTKVPQQAMSTKILGLGLFLVGVLLLSVALIIGLEFPKYVRTKIIEDQCILNKDHSKFESWRAGSQWNRMNRIYFWVLENKEGFLYHREEPKVKERGPYVYRETEEKTDITFNVNEVRMKLWRRHVFDATLTAYECGFDCTEQESLTVINQDFLQKTTSFGSESDYTFEAIPSTLATAMLHLGIDVSKNITDKLPAFGCLTAACDTFWSTKLSSTTDLNDLSFGVWIRKNDTAYKSAILTERGQRSFTEGEMVGIYNLLVTPSMLKNGNSSYSECLSWASHVACASSGSDAVNPNVSCGIISLLKTYTLGSVSCFQNFSAQIQQFLCSQQTPNHCFVLPSNIQLSTAYVEAITAFILSHIAAFVHEAAIVSLQNDLVTTRNQSELAFGYVRKGPDNTSIFVPGVFSDPWSSLGSSLGPSQGSSEGSRSELSSFWTLATCLQDRDIDNNMMVKKINGSHFAPKPLLKDGDMNVYLSSHTDFVPACGLLQACVACQPALKSHKVYIPEVWRGVHFNNQTKSTLFDNVVYTLSMANDTFTNHGSYDVHEGVQNMTGLYSYLVWMSNPHFVYSSGSYPTGYQSGGSVTKHLSSIDVEPDTGRLWQRKFRFQFNVGVTAKNIDAKRKKSLNVTYLGRPIPIYWTERSAEISQAETGHYNHKVGRLMRVSCGGLIGISVMSVIVMVISVVVCFLPAKTNRVAPVPDDNTLVHNHR